MTFAAETLSPELRQKRDELIALVAGFGTCAVAFSGGVDSAVVAKAAHLALGDAAVAVTAVSASLAAGELDEARQIATRIGIRHVVLETSEFENPDYLRNQPDRCFHCKTELYTQVEAISRELKVAVIANGANLDDQGDYRPGMLAAAQHAVRSPLLECKLTKAEVRQLAADWNLPVWDKPASPCLSSRIAYGEQVTPERVKMIDDAERFLRERGWRELRVRYHRGDLARIEVPAGAIAAFCDETFRRELTEQFRTLGFKYITLDLEGFRSGSLNQVLPLAELHIQRPSS